MLRGVGVAAGLVMAGVLGGCATAKEPERVIEVAIGPNGEMVFVVPDDASPEDKALAMMMQQAASDAVKQSADKAQEQAQEQALSEADIWSRDPDGNLVHLQSGATCPAIWAGMQRTQASVFREDGMDVGCNYNRADSATVMTFYAFTLPGADSLPELMSETMESIKTRQPLAKDTPYSAASRNGQYEAQTLAYENADGGKMRTSLLMTKVGAWYLKIRLTCRAEDARLAEETAGIAIIGQADRLKNPSVTKTARPDPV